MKISGVSFNNDNKLMADLKIDKIDFWHDMIYRTIAFAFEMESSNDMAVRARIAQHCSRL